MFDSIKQFLSKGFSTNDTGGMFGNVLGSNGLIINSEDYNDRVSMEKYNTSLLVHTCMKRIADVFASADFELYKVLSTQGDTEKILVHEVLDLLYRPNPINTKTEFMQALAINLVLSGETFIRIIRDEKGAIIGLINIRPDIVEVDFKDGKVTYIQYIDGKRNEYDNTQIIHIKNINPTNPLRGSGVLSPIINRVTAEAKSVALQNLTFTNQGRPDGILWIKGMPSDKAEEVKKGWSNTFTGRNSKNRIAFIGGDSEFKYQQLSLDSSDLQLLETMKALRDDIAMAFGVPKSMLTSDDVNLANADAGYKQFVNFTIKPMLVLFEETMNERFIEPFFAEALFIKHVEMVTEDKKMMIEELTAGIDKWITINEARLRSGFDPIEGGDKLFRNSGTTEITNLTFSTPVQAPQVNTFNGRKYLYEKLLRKEDFEKNLSKVIRAKMLEMDFFSYEPLKKAYIKTVHSATDKNIADLENQMSAFLLSQGKRVKNAMEEAPDELMKDAEGLARLVFDSATEKKKLKKFALENFVRLALRAGNAGRMPIKTVYEDSENFTVTQSVVNVLDKRAVFFAEQVNSTTWEKVKGVIVGGIESGEGRDVMARNLRKLFTDMSTVRARTIAQTEGTVVSNIGLQESFKQSQVVTGKKWLTAGDDKVRPEHQSNDNQVVDKDGAFDNGEHYPGEHSINCRCVIAPTIR